jgi:hypothetical protein
MDLAVARGAISEDRRKIYWEDIVQLPRKRRSVSGWIKQSLISA